ncbi:hypothetical protein GTY20_23175 [Streptomyces sp. SID4946]|nr:hypothetical protein [Streptomyces sp. SID4946]
MAGTGAVKPAESCPGTDQGRPSGTAGCPASRGSWVSGESNWKVYTQTPAAGSALRGQPVAFTAVKFGESCP